MIKFSTVLTHLCWLTLVNNAYSQTTDFTNAQSKLISKVEETFKKYPQEKLTLHTSQNSYASGQVLWYKIYALAYGKPSVLSKIVYIRLVNAEGKVLSTNKHQLENGIAHGDLNIPDSLHTGWYQLQAYTAWMLNERNSEIYSRKILIVNPRNKFEEPISAAKHGYKLTLYPEGGELINGFKNTIAFKAVNDAGMPVIISGEVLVNGAPSKTKLITIHDGMGYFNLETYSSDTYEAKITYPDKSATTIPLPVVLKTGVGLSITTGDEYVSVLVKSAVVPRGSFMIFAMQADGTSTCYSIKLQKGINEVRFKKTDFSEGIARFTIFDEQAMPVAERVVFINNNRQLAISPVKDSLFYSPKSGNSLSFKVTGGRGKPTSGPVSVSVTDAGADDIATISIVSDLLLSSELKGRINDPAYYFSNNSDSLRRQLDLVMLTYGWRHFTWEKIANPDEQPLKYQPETKQFAAGTIDHYDPVKLAKIKLLVLNPDSTKRFLNVEPDSTGRFIIDDRDLTGTAQVYYDAANKKNRPQSVKINFTDSVIDSVPFTADTTLATFPIEKATAGFIENLSVLQNAVYKEKTIMLKEVKVKTVRRQEDAPIIKDHVKTLTADRAFDLDMTEVRSIPPVDLMHYIIGRFPGLDIVEINGVTKFNYEGKSTLKDSGDDWSPGVVNPPSFYIDEVHVGGDDIRHLNMYDIALIRFVPPPVWFAPLNGGISGAIMIYLKNQKDNIRMNGPGRGLNTYKINGYTVQRQFAEPDYADPKLAAQPDYRTTLFWNPDVIPDANGEIKFKFFNSDQAKHYRFTIQGMDKDGNLGSYTIVK